MYKRSSGRELHFWAIVFGFLTYPGVMTKKYEKSTINICSVVYILDFPPCIYWASSRELQRRASILGNGIWSPYPFSSYDKKIQIYMFNICFLICILVFAPCVYIEIPLCSTRSELHFRAIVFGFLTYYILRSYDKKFKKSMINISFVVCILVFVPFLYIELPILSFGREFHFWAMGFILLVHLGTMTKKIRSLESIFALLFAL